MEVSLETYIPVFAVSHELIDSQNFNQYSYTYCLGNLRILLRMLYTYNKYRSSWERERISVPSTKQFVFFRSDNRN